MPKSQSLHYRERTAAASGEEPVYLAEISHPQLAEPVRVVNDTDDVISNGETFIACAFRVVMPDDLSSQMPRAGIAIDNVGRALTEWLEASDGGRGAKVRIMEVMRDTPDTIEEEYTLDLLNVKQTVPEVTGDLGYEDVLNQPGLAAYYRPENTPGIF